MQGNCPGKSPPVFWRNQYESIFKDADKALYYVKEHGRSGCKIYEA